MIVLHALSAGEGAQHVIQGNAFRGTAASHVAFALPDWEDVGACRWRMGRVLRHSALAQCDVRRADCRMWPRARLPAPVRDWLAGLGARAEGVEASAAQLQAVVSDVLREWWGWVVCEARRMLALPHAKLGAATLVLMATMTTLCSVVAVPSSNVYTGAGGFAHVPQRRRLRSRRVHRLAAGLVATAGRAL